MKNFLLLAILLLPSLSVMCGPVTWGLQQNVNLTSTTFDVATGTASWQGKATTTNLLPAGQSGYFEFRVPALSTIFAGLNRPSTGDFSLFTHFFFVNNGTFYIIYGGTQNMYTGSYTANDTFKISVGNGQIEYYQSGILVHSISNTEFSTYEYRFSCNGKQDQDQIDNIDTDIAINASTLIPSAYIPTIQSWQEASSATTDSYTSGQVAIGKTSSDATLGIAGPVLIGADAGTSTMDQYRMYVEGGIISDKVVVKIQNEWPDYVFSPDYHLSSLNELKSFIDDHGHLPNLPSAEEIKINGYQPAEIISLLLKQIEELTLYTIQQQEQLEAIQQNTK